MLNIVLYEPEIPPNTGNLIRLCANTGMKLHLIEPFGFSLDEKSVRRAGLDYLDMAAVTQHSSVETFVNSIEATAAIYALTTKASRSYTDIRFKANDYLLFGPESRGLPDNVREAPWITERIRIPMKPDSRSINLSNSAAIVGFEGLRQLGFEGLS